MLNLFLVSLSIFIFHSKQYLKMSYQLKLKFKKYFKNYYAVGIKFKIFSQKFCLHVQNFSLLNIILSIIITHSIKHSKKFLLDFFTLWKDFYLYSYLYIYTEQNINGYEDKELFLQNYNINSSFNYRNMSLPDIQKIPG